KTLTSKPAFQEDLPQLITNMKTASAELAPTVKQARETLGSLKSTADSAGTLLNQVSSVLPNRGPRAATAPGTTPAAAPVQKSLSIHQGIGFRYSQRTSDRFRSAGLVDPEFQLKAGSNTYSLGIFDIGGQNRLTAMLGKPLEGLRLPGSLQPPGSQVGYQYGLW